MRCRFTATVYTRETSEGERRRASKRASKREGGSDSGHPDRGARKFSKGTVRSSGSLLPYRSSRGNITRLILPDLGRGKKRDRLVEARRREGPVYT